MGELTAMPRPKHVCLGYKKRGRQISNPTIANSKSMFRLANTNTGDWTIKNVAGGNVFEININQSPFGQSVNQLIHLANLIKEAVKKEEKKGKEFFADFIVPIWTTFITIHKDYLASLRRYSENITDPTYTADKLSEDIYQDSVYTRDLRIELMQTLQSASVTTSNSEPKRFNELIDALSAYFSLRRGLKVILGDEPETIEIYEDVDRKLLDNPDQWGFINGMRIALIIYLSLHKDELEKGKKRTNDAMNTTETDEYYWRDQIKHDRLYARDLFIDMANDLQQRYSDVAKTYHQLKSQLLA